MTKTEATLHFRTIAALRQLIAEGGTAKRQRERHARLAEVVGYGVERGWNDASGNAR